jgi:hypothetical protein
VHATDHRAQLRDLARDLLALPMRREHTLGRLSQPRGCSLALGLTVGDQLLQMLADEPLQFGLMVADPRARTGDPLGPRPGRLRASLGELSLELSALGRTATATLELGQRRARRCGAFAARPRLAL